MELWVRSQDRLRLFKILYIEYGEWNEEHRIYVNSEKFAIYKTKERALEVLDEIQKYICPNGLINLYDGTRVYEMPKE